MSKARKRQKLEHTPSEDSNDDASFASFDDDRLRVTGDVADASEEEDESDLVEEVDGDEEEEEFHTSEEEEDDEDSMDNQAAVSAAALANGRGTLRPPALGTASMFTTQVQELLQQIRPKHTAREVEAEDALRIVKTTIDAISARGPLPIADARKALEKERITIPFPSPAPAADSNLKFEYRKPTSINVVGSYPVKTATRARKFLYVDMVVNMPSTIFQEKDYLDLRYFHKRAFYLACVASGLRAKHSSQFDIRFQNHHDDHLRPVITMRPRIETLSNDSDKPGRSWQINILPAIADDLFQASKLTPDRSCIRKGRTDSSPTSAYNSSIRADMLVSSYLKLLHKASTTCAAYKDACALGSTWLRQRGFRATYRRGGIASFEWSALTALLLTGGGPGGRPVISDRLESVQIFKATLQVLATKDLIKQPLVIGYGIDVDASDLDLPMVWDAVRGHNIFHKCSAWSIKHIQAEAKTTLAMLGDQQYDGFESAFIMRKDIELLNSDITIDVELKLRDGSTGEAGFTKLFFILHKGLGDRVRSIQMMADRSKPWSLDTPVPSTVQDSTVNIGLVVDSDHINRTVDHGPSVEDKAGAAEFRKLWSTKAELRRFKDGSITETLIWETGHGKPPVVQQIIRYLLKLHLNIAGDDISFSEDIRAKILGAQAHSSPVVAVEAFRTLETDIRSIKELPLPVRQIVPAISIDRSHAGMPREVVMQFESSGRWPDDLAAIQRTKIAFMLKISELLKEAHKPLTSRVGLENTQQDILNQGFLDIVYDTGAAFRIRLFHDREQTLLERQLKSKTGDEKTTGMTATALAAYKREYIKKPAHTQAMSLLYSRHLALADTVDLLSKWLQSHVLAKHFDDQLVELFAAKTFVQPWPWQTPTSGQTGFLRTLAWLARWDWQFEPVILDLGDSQELKGAALAAIRTRFEAWRRLDPAYARVAIFAASNVDTDGVTFTAERPSKVVASRLITLARAAMNEVQTQGLKLDVRTLFTSALVDYDFVLHINQGAVTGGKKRRSSSTAVYKNLELGNGPDPSMIGFQPIADLIEDLETVYGSAMLLFSGLPGRCVIGGLWLPHTSERPWKLNLTYSTKPSKASAGQQAILAQINKPAILSEIARIGEGLIDRIEVRQK